MRSNLMKYTYSYNSTLTTFVKANKRHQTEAEKLLWFHLRARQLGGYKFRRQYPILNYILDFYCPEEQLAIELDGSQHIDNIQYDRKRDLQLQKLNIQTIRFLDNDVLTQLPNILEMILDKLEGINKPHPTLS